MHLGRSARGVKARWQAEQRASSPAWTRDKGPGLTSRSIDGHSKAACGNHAQQRDQRNDEVAPAHQYICTATICSVAAASRNRNNGGLVGVLFVATGAYLAAVFLISDARRARDDDLERYFSDRALGAAVVTGAIAVAGILILRDDARYVYDGLVGEALPLVIASGVCGLAALILIRRGAPRGIRPLAVAAVVAIIWGWGVAQFPYLLPTELTIAAGAGTSDTLTMVIIVFAAAAVLVLPAIGLLYTLTQRGELEYESEPPGG